MNITDRHLFIVVLMFIVIVFIAPRKNIVIDMK